MENKEYLEHLQSIKGLIEERTKFKALSGVSGIAAGVVALIGAGVANYLIYHSDEMVYAQVKSRNTESWSVVRLVWVAAATLVLAAGSVLWFSWRNARLSGTPFWTKATRQLFFHFSIPMIVGGFFVLAMLMHGYYHLLATACLIFYGLALFAASHYTYSDIRMLSLAILLTGIVALFVPGRGLHLWAFGFGVLHIVYGSIMYFKYEK